MSAGWAITGIYAVLFGSAFAVVSAPVLNPVEGDSLAKFNLTITCTTPGSTIHYTLNGADPALSDSTAASGNTITIDRNFTVKAKAWTATEQSPTTAGALGDNTTVSKAMAVQVRTSASLFLTGCVAVAR